MKKSEGAFKRSDLVLMLLTVAIKVLLSFVAIVVIFPSGFFAIQGFLNACFSLRENAPALMITAYVLSSFIVLFGVFGGFWPEGHYKKIAVKLRRFCLFMILLLGADFYGRYDVGYHNARIRFFETGKIKFYRNILNERGTNIPLAAKVIESNGLEGIDRFLGRTSGVSSHGTGDLLKIPESELLASSEERQALRKLFINDSDMLFPNSYGTYVFETGDPDYAILFPQTDKDYSILEVVPIYKRGVVFDKQDGFLIVRWCHRDLLCGTYR